MTASSRLVIPHHSTWKVNGKVPTRNLDKRYCTCIEGSSLTVRRDFQIRCVRCGRPKAPS